MREFIFGMLIGIMGSICAVAWTISPHPMPRFIAHACDGAGGDLWAMDASDFPTRCKEIEEY